MIWSTQNSNLLEQIAWFRSKTHQSSKIVKFLLLPNNVKDWSYNVIIFTSKFFVVMVCYEIFFGKVTRGLGNSQAKFETFCLMVYYTQFLFTKICKLRSQIQNYDSKYVFTKKPNFCTCSLVNRLFLTSLYKLLIHHNH